MFASDYPHWDSEWPESTRPLRERTDLPLEVKQRILAWNAERFYRLPAQA
jgi:predicted TIM-barrel fold metal-dependent hydrolase